VVAGLFGRSPDTFGRLIGMSRSRPSERAIGQGFVCNSAHDLKGYRTTRAGTKAIMVAWTTFFGERNCFCGERDAGRDSRSSLWVGGLRCAGTGHRQTLTSPRRDSYSSTSESFQRKLHRINWVGDVPA